MVSHKIEIEGFIDPKSFVEKWSGLYSYGQEKKNKENYNLDPKKMDEAFFTYGQQLKKLIGKGIKITRFNNTK